MVVADTPQSHPDVPGPTTLIYETIEGGTRTEDRVHALGEVPGPPLREVSPLGFTASSCPARTWRPSSRPSTRSRSGPSPTSSRSAATTSSRSTTTRAATPSGSTASTPGGGDRSGDVQNIFQDNTRTVGIRMQEETAAAMLLDGTSTCRQLVRGCKFTLDRHFNGNGAYVLTRVEHLATPATPIPLGDERVADVHEHVPVHPRRAAVPAGADGHAPGSTGRRRPSSSARRGRRSSPTSTAAIKVQFPWDRQGKNNADSSCWIRVGDPLGRHAVGHRSTSRASARRSSSPSRRATRPADHRRQRLQRRGDAALHAARQHDPERLLIAAAPRRNRRQLQRAPLRGQEGLGGDLLPRREGLQPRRREQRHPQGRLRQEGQGRPDDPDLQQPLAQRRRAARPMPTTAARPSPSSTTSHLTVGNSQAKSGSQTITIYKDRTETVKTGNETVTIEQGNRTVTVRQATTRTRSTRATVRSRSTWATTR